MHVLWRGPGEIQVGIGVGQRQILTGLTPAEEKVMLAAPRLTPAERERSRRHRGIDDERWAELSAHLVEAPPPRAFRGTVVALDAHPITARIRTVLDRMAVTNVSGSASDVGQRVALLTDSWVTDPIRVRDLMATDVPHLPIVVEASGIVVGPAIVPGATPCTTCIHLARTEADPKWPLLAPQLAQLPGRRLSLVEIETAAALAAHALAGLLQGHMSSGWYVSTERCIALAPPTTVHCGCGGITPPSGDGLARA